MKQKTSRYAQRNLVFRSRETGIRLAYIGTDIKLLEETKHSAATSAKVAKIVHCVGYHDMTTVAGD